MSQHKRTKKTTVYQFGIMLDYFENHPEMINGKITNNFTVQRREKLWSDLSMLLNSATTGAQKTPQKWRKTWIDIKSEAKQRDRESKEQSKLRGDSSPPPLPLHLARILTLVRLSNALSGQASNESKSANQPCIIKESFTEEASPETEMLSDGNIELSSETNPIIKIENLADDSTFVESPFQKVPTILSCGEISSEPSTSVESPFQKVPIILSCGEISSELSTSVESPFQKVPIVLSSGEISRDGTTDISTTVESLCKNTSEIPSVPASISIEKNFTPHSMYTKASSKNAFDSFTTSSEIPKLKNSKYLPESSCEKLCDILATSVKQLNDVIKNSENRTITAFDALTKATAKANELREKQLQIEEERNRLYQERNEILFSLVNTFLEKKANHQH